MKIIYILLFSVLLLFTSSGCGKYASKSNNKTANTGGGGGNTGDTDTSLTLSRVTAPAGVYEAGNTITLNGHF